LFVAFLFDKERGPVVAMKGLKNAYTKFRCAIRPFAFDRKILDAIGGEEITDDHFCLDPAVGIAFFRKRDVHPIIQVSAQLAGISYTHS
jgi:hypothetical protein